MASRTRKERLILVVGGPTYFSPGDEKAFFDWLASIPCIGRVTGKLRDLHIGLKRAPNLDEMRELGALLKRYKMSAADVAKLKKLSPPS